MSEQQMTDEERVRETRYYSMEFFHFEGGGIPRFGTSYQLIKWAEPQPPDPPRREPQTSGEREAMILRPQRDYEATTQAWRALPYQVQVFCSLGALRFELRGVIAKSFLLWIGGMVACPACATCMLTHNTNNETCPQCNGKLLRCYDALVWARTNVEFAAGDWVDLGTVGVGTYFHTEQGTRGIVLKGDEAEDRPVAWAGSGELGRLPNRPVVYGRPWPAHSRSPTRGYCAVSEPVAHRSPIDWDWVVERLTSDTPTDHQALKVHCVLRAVERGTWEELYEQVLARGRQIIVERSPKPSPVAQVGQSSMF